MRVLLLVSLAILSTGCANYYAADAREETTHRYQMCLEAIGNTTPEERRAAVEACTPILTAGASTRAALAAP